MNNSNRYRLEMNPGTVLLIICGAVLVYQLFIR